MAEPTREDRERASLGLRDHFSVIGGLDDDGLTEIMARLIAEERERTLEALYSRLCTQCGGRLPGAWVRLPVERHGEFWHDYLGDPRTQARCGASKIRALSSAAPEEA